MERVSHTRGPARAQPSSLSVDALGDHQFYIPLASELAKQFTVYTLIDAAAGRAVIPSHTPLSVKLRMLPHSSPPPVERHSYTATLRVRRSPCAQPQPA